VAELAPRPDVPATITSSGMGEFGGFGCTGFEPLAPSRYEVVFTASTEIRDKRERLRGLDSGRTLALSFNRPVD
jgi:hypothetical protein